MKKTVICIVSTAAAFVLATALNIQNMIWGGTSSVLGFVFSLVFCACLFVLPAVAKNRAFAVVSACYAAFSAIASIVGLLAVKGIISDTVALMVVPPLTAFCGLSYIMSDYSVFYSVLIAFTLIAALNLILIMVICGGKSINNKYHPRSRPVSYLCSFMSWCRKSRTFCRNS